MEEPKETGLPEGTGTPAEPTPPEEGTPEPKPEPEPTDWEKRYKDLQVESTRASQEASELRTRVEQLEQPAETPAEGDEQIYDEEGFVDRKAVGTMIKDAVLEERKANRMERANSYFHRTYPELVDDEDAISGILRSSKHRNELLKFGSTEERVDFAVKKFQERLEKASADAKTQAEADAKEREEKNRKATGLGGPSTTPAKSDEGDISVEQEIKNRKSQSAKRRGLA